MTDTAQRDRLSALIIGGGSLLMGLAMAHHPTAHGHSLPDVLQSMARINSLNALVHGSLLGIIGLLALGYAGFSDGLAFPRLARAGRLAYFAGALAMSVAGLINGFAAPAVARKLMAQPAQDLTGAAPVFSALWELNQAFAAAGVVATAMAVVLWSIALVRQGGLGRWVGAAGIAANVGLLVALLGGWLTLDVHGFGLFVLVQAAWGLMVAAHMLWGRR